MVITQDLENKIIPYKMLLETITNTRELIERILPEDVITSLRIGLNKIEPVLKDYIQKAREGLPIVGYHFAFPAEYLKCFDCVPVCIEGTSYFLATLLHEGVEKYYDAIANWGHPFHTCTSQKGTMGMALEDLFKFDAIITPSAPCDSTCASYPFFKYEKKFPVVIADMPFVRKEESYTYFADQLYNSLIEVGKVIDQRPNFEKMKSAIEIENEVSKTKLELFDLIKAKPSPIESIFNPTSAGASIFISGTRQNLEFYQEVLDIAKERYKSGKHYGGEEKIRSIWPYMVTFFDISLCEWCDRELGMSVLFDIFNYNFSDRIKTHSDMDTLFYGMAKKAMEFPMVKQSTGFYYPFIEDCVKMAKEFEADCFIYTQSIACKQFGSIPKLLRKAIKEEVGIPTLIIEFDVGDSRVTSLVKFKEKLEMFVQTLL